VFRGKDSSVHRLSLLKYWLIYSIFYFSDKWLEMIIERMFDFYEYIRLVAFFLLVIREFRMSTWVYDTVLSPLLS